MPVVTEYIYLNNNNYQLPMHVLFSNTKNLIFHIPLFSFFDLIHTCFLNPTNYKSLTYGFWVHFTSNMFIYFIYWHEKVCQNCCRWYLFYQICSSLYLSHLSFFYNALSDKTFLYPPLYNLTNSIYVSIILR